MTEKTVKIQMHNGALVDLARDALVCVVYVGETGTVNEVQPHTSPCLFVSRKRPSLTIESGGTLVPAGLLADWFAAGDQRLDYKRSHGEIKVYPTAAEALELTPESQLLDPVKGVITMTRHAQTLRQWEKAENERPQPRIRVRAAIKERLRMFADHKTPQVSVGDIEALEQTARAAKAEVESQAASKRKAG